MMRHVATVLVAALALAAPVRAEVGVTVFDIDLGGVRAAVLTLSSAEGDGAYRATGSIAASGLLRLVARVRYAGEVEGRREGGRLVPLRYAERADTGRRRSEAEILWHRGLPQVTRWVEAQAGREAPPADPAEAVGALDPLSVLYLALAPQPVAAACALSLSMFDGARLSQVTLGAPQPDPATGGLTCTGEYRRIAGFHPGDMAERSRFPLRLALAPVAGESDLVQVVRVTVQTLYGQAVLKRR